MFFWCFFFFNFIYFFTLHTFVQTTDWATIFFNDHSKSVGAKLGLIISNVSGKMPLPFIDRVPNAWLFN